MELQKVIEKRKSEEFRRRTEEIKQKEEHSKDQLEEDKDEFIDKYLLEDGQIDDENLIKEDNKKISKEEIQIKKLRQNHRLISIKAIEFDWIFNREQGGKFLDTLIESNNLELFSISLIQYCIQFIWMKFRKNMFIFMFFPFLVYFA